MIFSYAKTNILFMIADETVVCMIIYIFPLSCTLAASVYEFTGDRAALKFKITGLVV